MTICAKFDGRRIEDCTRGDGCFCAKEGPKAAPRWVTSWPDWYPTRGNVTVIPEYHYDNVVELLVSSRTAHELEKAGKWKERALAAEQRIKYHESERDNLMLACDNHMQQLEETHAQADKFLAELQTATDRADLAEQLLSQERAKHKDVEAALIGQRDEWIARAEQNGKDAGQTKFVLQRKDSLPGWSDETTGHTLLNDALACVQYCRSTPDRPLRIVEVRHPRVVMDQAAIGSAIQEPK